MTRLRLRLRSDTEQNRYHGRAGRPDAFCGSALDAGAGIDRADDQAGREYDVRYGTTRFLSGPTITLEGDANGAPHPDPALYARKFCGKYAHRLLKGGIGHNPPQ